MRAISELLLEELVVAEIDAHPDDFITQINLITIMGELGIRMLNYTLTHGEATTKNHHPDSSFDPKQGHRKQEGKLGARRVGFETYTQLDGTDGNLTADHTRLVTAVAKLLVADEVDLIIGLTQFSPDDSPDHTVAGHIALEAARQVHEKTERGIGVLVVQPGMEGEWVAHTSTQATILAHEGAAANPSQFRYQQPGEQQDDEWPMVANSQAMHHKDLAELQQYPLDRDATYRLYTFGNLALPRMAEFV